MIERSEHRYGDHPAQVAELFGPAGAAAGVAVVIHGGFWRAAYDRHLMDDLCLDLAATGWAAWNLEYRRTAGGGGGWPATFEDVAAGIDTLSTQGLSLQRERVAAIGHSAGGHLAFWAAARTRLPAGAPGAEPVVRVTEAVAQAGVVDLAEGARLHLGRDAVGELVGNDPDILGIASPAELLPLGVPQLLVHGGRDDIVPAVISEGYAERASGLGDDVDLIVVPREAHFEHLDPRSESWRAVREWLARS